MNKLSRSIKYLFSAAAVAAGMAASPADAAYIMLYDGCLEGSASIVDCNGGRAGEADGTLTTSPEWSVNYLAWTVEFDDDTDLYRYTYDFFDATVGSQNASHSIIELSATFSSTNLKAGSVCSEAEIGTYTPPSPSNPGLPGPIYGIKCGGTQQNPYTVVLVTDRAPVWGDWYAKDGEPVHGYNTGFLVADPTDPPSDGSILNHVLVPDTTTSQCPTFPDCDVTTSPEPASLALFGLAALAAGAIRRRKK